MQTKIYKEDKGTEFGKWNDKTSFLLYHKTTIEILNKIKIPEKIADYGGANGNLKKYLKNIITIDIDKTKNPDIVDNIIKHKGSYDLIVIRYVLHYLNDYEVLELFQKIKSFHKGKILIIQFCNNNLKKKYKNSINEIKYFRTEKQLENLLPELKKIYSCKIKVSKKFYKNRLDNKKAVKHKELINAYYG